LLRRISGERLLLLLLRRVGRKWLLRRVARKGLLRRVRRERLWLRRGCDTLRVSKRLLRRRSNALRIAWEGRLGREGGLRVVMVRVRCIGRWRRGERRGVCGSVDINKSEALVVGKRLFGIEENNVRAWEKGREGERKRGREGEGEGES
jgi:hypothetical protein